MSINTLVQVTNVASLRTTAGSIAKTDRVMVVMMMAAVHPAARLCKQRIYCDHKPKLVAVGKEAIVISSSSSSSSNNGAVARAGAGGAGAEAGQEQEQDQQE